MAANYDNMGGKKTFTTKKPTTLDKREAKTGRETQGRSVWADSETVLEVNRGACRDPSGHEGGILSHQEVQVMKRIRILKKMKIKMKRKEKYPSEHQLRG